MKQIALTLLTILILAAMNYAADNVGMLGFVTLFNGKDLTGWKADAAATQHWAVHDGMIDYNGKDGDLWSQKEFGNFILQVDWRWSRKPVEVERAIILPDGSQQGTMK